MIEQIPNEVYMEIRGVLLERDGKLCHYCGRPLLYAYEAAERIEARRPAEWFRTTQRQREIFMGYEQEVNRRKVTIDHKRARCFGGTHELDNLVLACAQCNYQKNNDSYEQFYRLKATTRAFYAENGDTDDDVHADVVFLLAYADTQREVGQRFRALLATGGFPFVGNGARKDRSVYVAAKWDDDFVMRGKVSCLPVQLAHFISMLVHAGIVIEDRGDWGMRVRLPYDISRDLEPSP